MDSPKRDAMRTARGLLQAGGTGALSVLDINGGGPFTTLVNVATEETLKPILLISGLSHHTKCLKADPRASVMLHRPIAAEGDPMLTFRVTVSGIFAPVEDEGALNSLPETSSLCGALCRTWGFWMLAHGTRRGPYHRRFWPGLWRALQGHCGACGLRSVLDADICFSAVGQNLAHIQHVVGFNPVLCIGLRRDHGRGCGLSGGARSQRTAHQERASHQIAASG